VPKSTLSDAQAIFDPNLVGPLVADLYQRVPSLPHAPELDELLKTLTAVDGSFFAMAPRVSWAVYNKPNATPRQPRKDAQRGNIRMDLHFNVLAGVPEQAIVSDGRRPEYQTLSELARPDHFYVLDRAYHCYQSWADILAVGSDFLVRLRADMRFEVVKEHELSAADRLAGVVSCQTVQVRGGRGQAALGTTPLRLVEIVTPEGSRLRLLTNRLDLSPELLGVLYRYRWQIELFFRWLKCMVNFRHFFSESQNGVALQIGAAVIGTLLIALAIEARPSSYDWAMLTHVTSGLLPLDEETMRIMSRRRARGARAAAWQKAYRARKKSGD